MFPPDTPLVDLVRPSPNHGDRRGQAAGRDRAALHGHADCRRCARAAVRPAAEVSAHYFVFEDGRIAQLVPEERRAWHAGRSSWRGETDMNSASIGVEIVNPGHDAGAPPFPAAQIEAVAGYARHHGAPRNPAGAGSGPFRHCAGPKGRPGRAISLARTGASAGVGFWRRLRRTADGPGHGARRDRRAGAALQERLAAFGYGWKRRASTMRRPRTSSRRFSAGTGRAVDGMADVATLRTLAACRVTPRLALHRNLAQRPGVLAVGVAAQIEDLPRAVFLHEIVAHGQVGSRNRPFRGDRRLVGGGASPR